MRKKILAELKSIKKNKYIIIGSLFFLLLSFFISKKTTSNDLYMQFLAIEKITSNFDFTGVGGHPIGFALIGSFLKVLNLDPLIIFYYAQPFISSFCFILLFKIINTICPCSLSFFISLIAMSSLIIIKAMNQFGAEIFSLASILILILYTIKNIILTNRYNNINLLWLIIFSWIAIFLRNASMFIITGIALFLFICGKFNKKKYVAISTLMLIPGIIKSLLSVDNSTSMINLFSFESIKIFFSQAYKHIGNLKEVIFPNILHFNKFPVIKFSIGFFLLIFCTYVFLKKNKKQSQSQNTKLVGDLFFVMGLSYYIILSFASSYLGKESIYSTDWGSIYRVSGFGIIFFLTAFWVYVIYIDIFKKEFIIYALAISCSCKVAYGLRYELIYGPTRLLFDDYRNSANTVINYMEKSKYNKLVIYTSGHYQGKNLYYLLKYYDMIYSLPFKIETLEASNKKKNNVNFFCAKNDLHFFNKSIDKEKKVKNLNGFYLIEV